MQPEFTNIRVVTWIWYCLAVFLSNNSFAQARVTTRGALIVVPAAAVVTVPGDFRLAGNNDSVYNYGTIIMSGNFINNGKSFYENGSGVEIFNGATTISGSLSKFNNIEIKPGATVTLGANIDVKNNWTNNGSFNHGNKIVSFSGTVPVQNIIGSATFYDVKLQNAVNFGLSRDTIENSFSNSAGGMIDGTSRVVFKGSTSIIGAAAKFFYDLEILNSAVVTHTTGGGNIHVAHNFINNGTLTENVGYNFYFDSSNSTETMSGAGTATFGKLVIGNNGFSGATTLNCSADFTIAGGSISFQNNSVYNGINNTATFSVVNALISGTGTANFYNATTNAALNLGSGVSKINKELTINPGGSIITNAPVYGSSSILTYNTTTANLNTGIEWTGNAGSAGAGAPFNVKIQNANNIILPGSRTVPGVLTIAASNSLNINGYTLTVNGGFSGTGLLKGNTSSALITDGTGKIYFDATANTLKALTVDTTGNTTLGNALNIAAGNSVSGYGTVTVNGTLTGNGFLTLKSDSNGTARVGISLGIISGDVTVERFIAARRAWRFLNAPFQGGTGTSINAAWQEGQTSNTLSCPTNDPAPAGYGTHLTYNGTNGYDANITGNPSLKVWQNNTWVAPPSTITKLITDYPAYCVFVRGDRHICLNLGVGAGSNNTVLRARGILNETGASSISKNFTASAPGNFIFVGNPYASSIDLAPILSSGRSSGIQFNKFWVWDPKMAGSYGVGGYVTFLNGVQVPPASATYTAGTIIQSGQAFMVQLAETSTSATIKFRQTDKVASESNVFFAPGNNVLFAPPRRSFPVLYACLMSHENELTLVDAVGAGFGDRFSPNVDSNDAKKLWNVDENIALMRDGKFLSIEFRPRPKLSDTLFLRLYPKMQPYVLQLFSEGFPLKNVPIRAWLLDKYLDSQTEVNLYDTTFYSFTPDTDTNSYRNRFQIVLKWGRQKEPVVARAVLSESDIATGKEKISIYPNPVTGNKLILHFSNVHKGSYELIVYNSKGEKLESRKIEHSGGNNNYFLTLNSSWPSSVYTLCISDNKAKTLTNLKMVISK